ncbi:hypothetical protein [Eubacterium callanderi]|uniref:hypothetical protein n=1 Tax=Eubacterium callanderi TaxID=53442 RepID=UPI001C116449|nr:hypothetical protein [Eubacterium callanderi]MBU5305223.1 hypothetical protein [Eubacterium callanderi]
MKKIKKKIINALGVIASIFLIGIALYGFYVNYEKQQVNMMLKSNVEQSDACLEEIEEILKKQKEDLEKSKATRSELEERIAQIENVLGIETN